MHVIAAKAVALKEALEPEFKVYQAKVIENAKAMAEVLNERGYPIISGGTEADAALGRAYITVNKNSVPNDPQSPFVTSGLRLGTPAITTRGFGVEETRQLTGWIADILDDLENEETIDRVRSQVLELCARFPVYG
jgi:glycine hydroxymethyltransferase